MKDLIKIENTTVGDESVPTISARELHEFLGVKRDFSNWIKDRIAKYQFEEEKDYIIFENLSSPNLASSKSRPQKLKEYQITLDVAKELSMVENNEKGREARKYFIQCEKELKTFLTPKRQYLLNIIEAKNDISRAAAINDYEIGYVEPLEQFKEQALPKVDFFDTVTASEKLIDIGESSKVLLFEDLGRNNLFKVLRELKILDKNNVPYQKYVSRGYFKLIETTINGKPYIKTGVYQKGLDFLNKTLANAGYERLPR